MLVTLLGNIFHNETVLGTKVCVNKRLEVCIIANSTMAGYKNKIRLCTILNMLQSLICVPVDETEAYRHQS